MIALPHGAAQHRPRPLPLFLSMLRSETAADADRRAAALAGLRLYQDAPRSHRPPPAPVVAQAGRAVLRDHGGAGPKVVVVPSLINPPDVLDLTAERSLLRWLARQGLHPLLVDWGSPAASDHALDVAGHVERMLLPLIRTVGTPPALIGYCLGGTMALAAAARTPTRGVALIAAPWRFGNYPEAALATLDDFWSQAAAPSEALGRLPMEMLQAAFWRMDPARTIGKYAALGRRDADDPAIADFVRLEDWANDGPPLTHGAARELFDDLFASDATGRGRWMVDGRPVRLEEVSAPILDIASTTDRIVPADSSCGRGDRIELALGHVGMVIGGRARELLWEPLAAWLSRLPPS